MKQELFRKKSLERISSPEKIDDYIKTVNVRLWLVAAACMLVMISLFLWGIFGKIEITQRAATVCENGEAVCYIREENREDVSEKTDFRVNGQLYRIKAISDLPQKASEVMPEYAAHIGLFKEDEWVYAADLNTDLEDGIYETEVITAAVSPVHLFMN